MVVAPFLFLLAAVTVREDAPLRDDCDLNGAAIIALKAGQEVDIRFALNDGSSCYKVRAAGQTGYLNASQLEGLGGFQQGRIAASDATASIKITTVEIDAVRRRAAAAVEASGPLAAASKLIEANQPAAALAALEPIVSGRNPGAAALTLAGIAAWRNDNPQAALGYWKQALDLAPDSALQNLYAKVQRETGADRSRNKSIGLRVNLRYESDNVPADVAQEMLTALDSEYARISTKLSCRAEERITAVVQSREAYMRTTGAAEWSGGVYDGRIHIALPEGRSIGAQTRRVFAHELVHACLSSLGRFPSWFQEGMAQKLSGDQLSPAHLAMFAQRLKDGSLPHLSDLAGGWSRLSIANAQLAYALSLRAADLLPADYINLVRNPSQMDRLTAEIDRRLREP